MPCLWLFRSALPVVRDDSCVEAFLERKYKGRIFDASAVFASAFDFCAEVPKDKTLVDNCFDIFGGIYNKDGFLVSAYRADEL